MELQLKVVSQIVEAELAAFVYRFETDLRGFTMIKRTRVVDPLWGHGVMVQSITNGESTFQPLCNCGFLRKWMSLEDACAFVKEYARHE